MTRVCDGQVLASGKVDDAQGIALLKEVAQHLHKLGTAATAPELLLDASGKQTQSKKRGTKEEEDASFVCGASFADCLTTADAGASLPSPF